MRILITGDREWKNAPVLRDYLFGVASQLLDEDMCYPDLTLITGCARGADTIADIVVQLEMADADGMPPRWRSIDRYPALWDEHGRAAGLIRNQQMLDSGVDHVVAFHNDLRNSHGTRDMLRRCAAAGIAGNLFTEEGEVEEWLNLL